MEDGRGSSGSESASWFRRHLLFHVTQSIDEGERQPGSDGDGGRAPDGRLGAGVLPIQTGLSSLGCHRFELLLSLQAVLALRLPRQLFLQLVLRAKLLEMLVVLLLLLFPFSELDHLDDVRVLCAELPHFLFLQLLLPALLPRLLQASGPLLLLVAHHLGQLRPLVPSRAATGRRRQRGGHPAEVLSGCLLSLGIPHRLQERSLSELAQPHLLLLFQPLVAIGCSPPIVTEGNSFSAGIDPPPDTFRGPQRPKCRKHPACLLLVCSRLLAHFDHVVELVGCARPFFRDRDLVSEVFQSLKLISSSLPFQTLLLFQPPLLIKDAVLLLPPPDLDHALALAVVPDLLRRHPVFVLDILLPLLDLQLPVPAQLLLALLLDQTLFPLCRFLVFLRLTTFLFLGVSLAILSS
mmetsp:Transcript_129600/g.414562  ORF Transcript_129600/g.414562 Transcript_129600/m.414562 type:complete len:407 (-) Transcript_129600:832-2052(-)